MARNLPRRIVNSAGYKWDRKNSARTLFLVPAQRFSEFNWVGNRPNRNELAQRTPADAYLNNVILANTTVIYLSWLM